MSNLSWLKSIYPQFQSHNWHTANVYKPSDLKYEKFFERGKPCQAIINPSDIVGIEYAYAYNCLKQINWLQLLGQLKRLDSVKRNFKTRTELIQYIHNNDDKKVVLKFGNHLFTISGQHRLCLAKFLDVSEVEVTVIEYKLNKERLVKYHNLNKFYQQLESLRIQQLYSEKDKDKYKIQLFELSDMEQIYFRINEHTIFINHNLLKPFIIYYKKVKVYKALYFFQYHFYNALYFLNNDYFSIDIETEKDFKKLKALIIKHKNSLRSITPM
jgi:hypothetical protein